jgi:hypothetical protein
VNDDDRQNATVQVPSGTTKGGSLLAEFFDRNMHSHDFRRILGEADKGGA